MDEYRVLEKVYLRYLDNPTNRPYMKVFLKYAALYQYEIQFEPSKEDVESVEALTELGLLEFNSETEYHTFCHSDFAKLLLKSFASRPAFERNYRNLQDFIIQQIKSYLSSFEIYPSNFNEVFINLVVNKGVPIFKRLLQDIEIKKQTICFYQNIDSAYNLARFLYNVHRYAPEYILTFSEPLIISHPSVKILLLNADDTLFSFVLLLQILQKINVVFRDTFLKLFDPEEQKHIVLSSSFHIIRCSLSSLRKSDIKIARVLLNCVAANDLTHIAKQGFAQLGSALNELKNIDKEKTKQIFNGIELTIFIEKAQQVSFDRLGNALSNLHYVNVEKTREILKSLDFELLVSKIRKEKYIAFICHIPSIVLIDSTITQQLLTKLPDKFLFQFEVLKYLQNFNRLLFAFNLSGLAQYAEKLVAFASENMDSFMRSKNLKDIASLLNLCSHYLDIKSIIEQYHHKFPGKLRFGEPSEIPFFIRVIHDHDKEIALELLRNIEAKNVLGYCFYQLATSFSEQENFIDAINYLKKAIPMFEEVKDNTGLCYTYFALAKNSFALNNAKKAKELSEKALSYAQLEDRHDLQEEINGFITDNL